MSTTQTATLQPVPYLAFDGKCAEAMHYYEQVFGGKIKFMMSGAQAPIKDPMMEAFGDRIMNCQFEMPGGMLLMGGDCPPGMPFPGIHGVSIALQYNTADEGEAIFDKLADGGSVTMPYAPTFWADKFGMVTDKYGVHWMINGNLHHFE